LLAWIVQAAHESRRSPAFSRELWGLGCGRARGGAKRALASEGAEADNLVRITCVSCRSQSRQVADSCHVPLLRQAGDCANEGWSHANLLAVRGAAWRWEAALAELEATPASAATLACAARTSPDMTSTSAKTTQPNPKP
jgi:hypothetical protein